MTIVVEKTSIVVTIQRDADAKFPYDDPHAKLEQAWAAILILIKSGNREGRLRIGDSVDVLWHQSGVEEEVEAGDN